MQIKICKTLNNETKSLYSSTYVKPLIPSTMKKSLQKLRYYGTLGHANDVFSSYITYSWKYTIVDYAKSALGMNVASDKVQYLSIILHYIYK